MSTTHTHGGTDAPECTSCTTANPDPIAELLAGVPITGLRHTGTESFLTRVSAQRLADVLRIALQEPIRAEDPHTSNTLENKTKGENQ